MIYHFESFETASLFAAQRRSEGYFARTLDSNVSHFWGPLPVIGARVVMSDDPVDDAPPPPEIIWSRRMMPFLNLLTLALAFGGILALVAAVLASADGNPTGPDNSLENLVGRVLVGAILSTLVSLFMIRATREDRLRQPGEVLSTGMKIIAILLILF